MKTQVEKTLRAVANLTAIALGCLVFAVPASAVEKYRVKDGSVGASFYSVEPSGVPGCDNVTYVYVSGYESTAKYHTSPGKPNESEYASTFLTVYQYDSCNYFPSTYIDCFGNADNLQIDRNLNSATLETTLSTTPDYSSYCYDYVNYTDTVQMSVNLNWVGVGETARSNSHYNYHFPGLSYHVQSNGVSRDAEASGTVSDGVSNFTPNVSGYASLGRFNSGSVTIYKP